jgi:hypothetical protein
METKTKNPFFNSKGKYKTETKIYNIWDFLMKRCYSQKEKYPAYKDCYVCNEWLDFQIFAEWYENNYIDNFHLDKDILIKNNKIYSPETCCFVPKEINFLFIKGKTRRGDLPIGVRKHGNNYQVSLRKFSQQFTLGTYNTIEEAFKIYKIEKEKYIKEVAEIWKHKIPEKVYKIMINYQVEIID